MTGLNRLILAVAMLTLTACAGRSGIIEEFDRSAKAYNRMLRWQEMESAGMTYIIQERQEEYLKQVALLKKRGLSITDFRILSSRCTPESNSGDVVAEFDYYLLPSNRIKTLSYRQEWVYQEKNKSWQLKSGLPPFD